MSKLIYSKTVTKVQARKIGKFQILTPRSQPSHKRKLTLCRRQKEKKWNNPAPLPWGPMSENTCDGITSALIPETFTPAYKQAL